MPLKLKVSKESVLDGLQRVQNVVSTHTTLPILSNALVQAGADGLTLTATDLDVGVRTTVEAEVLKPGATTLPVKRLFSIIREMPGGEIEMEVDEKNSAAIRCGSSYYKIMGLPIEEFPPFPKGGEGKALKTEQQKLRELLKKTAYAASTDETRFVLNGVHVSWKGDKLTVVATDGRRLALVEEDVEAPKGSETEFTVPSKAVVELLRQLGDKGDVKLWVGENQLLAEFDKTTLSSRLIEGTYPNYRQVIPSEAKERISLERELLLSALHRAALLASDKTQSVKLNFSKNKLTITATTPEVGEAQETMAINYKGKDLSIGFNPQYLMDPLRVLDADEVFLELTDEISPGALKINGPFLYVLMPMRLSA